MVKIILIFLMARISVGIPAGGAIGSEYFTVRYAPNDEKIARYVHQSALKARTEVENKIGITVPKRVMILVIPGGKKKFEASQPQKSLIPDWAIGTAYPKGYSIVLKKPDNVKFRFNDVDKVVLHEYLHIAISDYLGETRVPRWLEEGIPTALSGERTLSASATIGIAAISGSIIPFEKLDYSWPLAYSQADLAYAQSADFMAWLMTKYNEQIIRQILQNLKETHDINKALIKATGNPLSELQKLWLKEKTRYYFWIPILTGSLTIWFIASVLVILGYKRKRKKSLLKMKFWELEEIYGSEAQHSQNFPYKEKDDNGKESPSLH